MDVTYLPTRRSVGCTVIELLEGKPPYYKLASMQALFRIVNDDHPPLPEGSSVVCRYLPSEYCVLVWLTSISGMP